MRMTPGNLDIYYPVTGNQKEPEMLIVASIRTLKRKNEKCRKEEVFTR